MKPNLLKTEFKGMEDLATSVFACDKNLVIKYINPSAEILFELSHDQALNENISLFFTEINFFKDALRQAKAKQSSYREYEYFVKTKQNKTICVSFTITPIEKKEFDFIVEFSQMDQQLRVAREERMFIQQQANSELLRNLAHEIRNPLGGLRGAAQLLEKELKEKSLKEYTQVIIDEADRLQNLMNKLLIPHQLPLYKKTNIHEVLERVRSLILSEFPENLNLTRDYDVSLPEFIGDREKLIQAVLNVARNGVQAMLEVKSKGKMNLNFITRAESQIVFHKKKHTTAIRLDIIDSGPGIDKKLLDKIFYPLVSGKDNGSGLGLSLAQNFITQHNGMIDCSSTPGKTKFSIVLPIENNLKINEAKK
ncbi:nitrogen regulation protein NR(II) [Methylophilaceae bacterium]|jgi:two-component system, NtrC family, nitrogen regulation sensor histidine kinase GlnL|nr:nitrogen regulation protein NR(II) [Methylophilaceae bacterium]|tara:strand:+ start:796 stop:1893 length:1098 start_codon:yes stop_codon:yes gene_type:complete